MISPIEITAPVQQLIDRIRSEYIHEIVPVVPDPEAIAGKCYSNVADRVSKDGGNLVYGWAVWLSDFICEGEHYAVWEDRDGNLTDITPNRAKATQLLFIPDDRYIYEGVHIGNIRVSVGDNPLTEHLILLSDMKDYVLRYATRVDDENINFNTYTGNMYNHYNALRDNLQLYLENGGKMGTPCYCGSSKPYSKCHGKDLKAAIAIDKKNVTKVNE